MCPHYIAAMPVKRVSVEHVDIEKSFPHTQVLELSVEEFRCDLFLNVFFSGQDLLINTTESS